MAHITSPESGSAWENRCTVNELFYASTRQAYAGMVVGNDPGHFIEQFLYDILGESLPEHE
ncbi:MAG: hypothetical protein WCC92_04855 [Candidatus Korobacteraceae bacterium]